MKNVKIILKELTDSSRDILLMIETLKGENPSLERRLSRGADEINKAISELQLAEELLNN